ncbi:MAG: hypothetical protein K8F30_03885, partial [Taibaiella sp.]|nr:hypothetical protein [Taibaiella sp.]
RHTITGNILTPKSKKIIHYSYNDFINSIVKGGCCFICGASRDSKPFNDEHVIPKWILKHYGTPESFTILPNTAKLKYSEYKVPCCTECNSELGITVEAFMSKFFRRNYEEISADLEQNERIYLKLFHWLCLLFFKTHYKDCFLRIERDQRKPSGSISDTYCWRELYHVHMMARQHYTRAQISDKVYGSIMVFEALKEPEEYDFDYLDNLNSQTIMVKIGQTVILAVLNDSRFCLAAYREFLSRISGSLSTIQIRELFARLRYANQNIKERPRFYTAIDRKKGHRIKVDLPNEIEILQGEQERVCLFKLMRFYLEDIMSEDLPNRQELLEDIENGRAQYIFDEDYNFFQY